MLILGTLQGGLFFIYNFYIERTLMAFSFLLLAVAIASALLLTIYCRRKNNG
jgi:hypothetical protein